jgi:flagellar biosynthetic protein FliR
VNLDFVLDPGLGIGLLLAQIRVVAFMIAAPQLGSAVPGPGRLAFGVSMGFAFASPVTTSLATPQLIAHGLVNAIVGATLGFLVGVLFQLFAIAGSLIDTTSGFSVATVIDPTRNGEQGAVLSRMFQVAGLTLFHVGGGLALLVSVLAWSIDAVPLDGQVRLSGALVEALLELTSLLVVSGFELAMPVMAALFLVEVVLGLASRFAPTANVFLLGMPVKVMIAMLFGSASVVLFPTFLDGMLDVTRDTMVDVINSLVVT